MATFTLAHDGKSCSDRTDRILAAFSSVRKSAVWKRCVRGAVAVIETTLGGDQRHWHIHLHVLFDGDFLPHAQLKKAWMEATGDSYIVDLKFVHGRKQAVHYITSYIGKPLKIDGWTDDEIREYATAMHGRRLLNTSGSFHNPKEDDDSEPDTKEPSVHLAGANALLAADERGSEHVRHAADILSRLCPNVAVALDRTPTPKNSVLPKPDPREIAWAIEVAEHVESRWPLAPEPAVMESARRRLFSLPEPQPPPRERQAHLQDRSGW